MSTNTIPEKTTFKHCGSYGRLRVLLREAHRKGNRFCFVLGAGASQSSGIPAGGELTRRWLVEHYRIDNGTDPRPEDPLVEELKADGAALKSFSDQVFSAWLHSQPASLRGMTPANIDQFYSHIYALRFEGAEDQGHDYLRRIIQGKRPGIGYAYLARLMAGAPNTDLSANSHRPHSPHNVVITVNFDNLIAEALVLYEKRYSVVCGHEVMASEIHPAEEIPLVVKLHADLMLRPRSRPQDIDQLAEPWKALLRRFGQSHRFIFLGYGGNDPGFMGFLANELKVDDLEYEPWWGYYTPDPKTPDVSRQPGNPLVAQFLNTHRGTIFPVPTFDLMMHALLEDTGTPHPKAGDVKDRADEILAFFQDGENRLIAQQGGNPIGENAEPAPIKSSQPNGSAGMPIRSAREWALRAFAAPSFDEAIAEYEAGVAEHPGDTSLRCNYAVFLQERGRSPERVRELYSVIPKMPLTDPPPAKDAWWIGNYALFLAKEGRFEEAETFYLRAVNADPKQANNLGNYANFLVRRGRFDEAEAFYRRAIEIDPKHADHLGNYGVYLKDRERLDEAGVFFRRAIEANSQHTNHLGNYAIFLETRGQFDEAEAFYRRAAEADPKHSTHLGNYANFLKQRGRFDEAEAFYKRAVEADPKHASNLGNYANFLADQRKDLGRAEEFYKRAVEADPKHANHLGNYAVFLNESGRFDEAEGFFRRAIEADRTLATHLCNYAQHLFILGRDQEAETGLNEVQDLSPTRQDVLVELAFYRAAHIRTQWPTILAHLKGLLASGARSPGWNLAPNVKAAAKAGHPNVPLLETLAAVISAGADLATLDAFPEWKAA